MPGWTFALLDDSQDTGEVEPRSAGGRRLPGPANSWRERASSTPVSCALEEFPRGNASVCTRPKHQAGERNGKGTAPRT